MFKEGKGGGTGRVASEISDAFATEGYETAILRPGSKYGQKMRSNGLIEFTYKTISKENLSFSPSTIKHINRIFFMLDLYSPDIVHSHDFDPIALFVQIWCHKHKVPFVTTLHVFPKNATEFGASDVLHPLLLKLVNTNLRSYMKAFLGGSSGVVAITEEMKEELIEEKYRGFIEVIENGRDLGLYNTCNFADIGAEKKELAFVGCLCSRKNQEFLLRVMKYLPRTYSLKLIGNSLNRGYQKKLLNIINREGLGNVKLLGEVNHEDVHKYLENAHLFISASKVEVFSLSFIEALASGTPIVALDNCSTRILINNNNGRALPSEVTPQEFARHVEDLCSLNKNEYIKLCEGARRTVKDLDWSNIVQRTYQYYEKVIDAFRKDSTSLKKSSLKKVFDFFKKENSLSDKIQSKDGDAFDFSSKNNRFRPLIYAGLAAVVTGVVYSFMKLTSHKKNTED